jgi:hypothetical protein
MSARVATLRQATLRQSVLYAARVLGAIVGYGFLALFLALVGLQVYRWLRDGEWTHIGVTEGLRVTLERCCVSNGATGPLARLSQWLATPVNWLGLHKVLELLPASLALFTLSILGNCLFVYSRDSLEDLNAPDVRR